MDATDKAHLRAKEAAAEAARLKAKEAEVWNLIFIPQSPSLHCALSRSQSGNQQPRQAQAELMASIASSISDSHAAITNARKVRLALVNTWLLN